MSDPIDRSPAIDAAVADERRKSKMENQLLSIAADLTEVKGLLSFWNGRLARLETRVDAIERRSDIKAAREDQHRRDWILVGAIATAAMSALGAAAPGIYGLLR